MDPYVGEIRLFGFNYPTLGWALCNGQIYSVQQYSQLFALIGAQYGGNGTTTFAVPNYCGRAPASWGTGPGLPQVVLGQSFGSEGVTLLSTEMPNHSHSLNAYLQGTDRQTAPANGYSLASSTHASSFLGGTPPVDTMFAPQTIGVAGGSQPHENRQPFLALNFCIALEGIYPSFG